eukprot:g9209.t1
MAAPLSLAFSIVKGLLSRVKDVKTNREDCELLASLVQKTETILHQFDETRLGQSAVTVIELLTQALQEAQEAVEKCCQASIVSAMLYSENYAVVLKHAASKIEHSLLQIPLASVQTDADLQSNIADFSSQLNRVRFEERAARVYQTKALKDELEKAFYDTHKGTEEVKELILELVQKQNLSTEARKEELAALRRDAFEANINKEKQLEFELNEIIEVLSKSLEDTSTTQVHVPNMEDLLRCPISKDIMRDPVIVNETGSTYERSSIEEWFRRGHHVDPLSHVKLTSRELIPNRALQATCLAYLGKSERSLPTTNDPKSDEVWTLLHKAAKENSLSTIKVKFCLLFKQNTLCLEINIYWCQHQSSTKEW